MNSVKKIKPTFYFLFITFFLSCSTDEDSTESETSKTYNTEVHLTDSPIDNAEVKGVFLTIADVKINGNSVNGFSKTTIDVSSLTGGSSKLLGDLDLEAGTTSNILLVLNNETDASGKTPGSYVLITNGSKKALITKQNTININDNTEIFASEENRLVMDFDLRKSIKQSAEGNYSFVSNGRISNNVRIVNTIETGTITGNISNATSTGAGAVVVYAYEAGSYNENEVEEDGNGMIFTHAVSSAAVNASNGQFSLHFLEEGEYELVFASYEDSNNDGQLELQGELQMNLTGNLTLDGIVVESQSTVKLDLAVEGLLGL